MKKKMFFIMLFLILAFNSYAEKCERQWKCEGEFRRYRNSGCEILVEEYCQYGCHIDGCTEVKKCDVIWKCNGNFREHTNEDCITDLKVYCQYGCSNATCTLKPAKKTEEKIADKKTAEINISTGNLDDSLNKTSLDEMPPANATLNETAEKTAPEKEPFFSKIIRYILSLRINFFLKVKD